jgi:hypothetical protein
MKLSKMLRLARLKKLMMKCAMSTAPPFPPFPPCCRCAGCRRVVCRCVDCRPADGWRADRRCRARYEQSFTFNQYLGVMLINFSILFLSHLRPGLPGTVKWP